MTCHSLSRACFSAAEPCMMSMEPAGNLQVRRNTTRLSMVSRGAGEPGSPILNASAATMEMGTLHACAMVQSLPSGSRIMSPSSVCSNSSADIDHVFARS